MVIAFSIILYICTFIPVIQNNTNPSSIAIHVPGDPLMTYWEDL